MAGLVTGRRVQGFRGGVGPQSEHSAASTRAEPVICSFCGCDQARPAPNPDLIPRAAIATTVEGAVRGDEGRAEVPRPGQVPAAAVPRPGQVLAAAVPRAGQVLAAAVPRAGRLTRLQCPGPGWCVTACAGLLGAAATQPDDGEVSRMGPDREDATTASTATTVIVASTPVNTVVKVCESRSTANTVPPAPTNSPAPNASANCSEEALRPCSAVADSVIVATAVLAVARPIPVPAR